MTVLVVEDHADIREMLSLALARKAYAIAEAADTNAGLERLRRGGVDLVITDLTMPGGGGRAILAAARALPDPPPVLLVTGSVEGDLAPDLMAAGAAACFQKPFNLRDIVAEVGRQLGRCE